MLDVDAFRVTPGSKVSLDEADAARTPGVRGSGEADAMRTGLVEQLAELGQLLWADNRYALLVVLQGTDASGKDGTIRKVFSGVNPQGCRVTSFKKPTEEELERDFLWRVHMHCPRRGEIGVFNRSHYEDIIEARVQGFVPEEVWRGRYGHVRNFEQLLHDGGTRVVKIFLHISRREQKERLEERLSDPLKGWKVDSADMEKRGHWEEYQQAYRDVLRETSTEESPWYVVPADKKWYRNALVASILVHHLRALKLRVPEPDEAHKHLKVPD